MKRKSDPGFVHYKRDPDQLPLAMDIPETMLGCVRCARQFENSIELQRHYKSAHKVLAPLVVIRRLTA
jgi:hypothetical protein